MTRDGRNGISRTGSGAPIANGRKKYFGGRTPGSVREAGDERSNCDRMDRRPPLWVYLFGLFAVAFFQRWLFPPDEHSVAFNVVLFVGLAAAVVVLLTALQRTVKR